MLIEVVEQFVHVGRPSGILFPLLGVILQQLDIR
jgi:hypothetical protein